MAFEARQEPALRPATVAVHDDGDVAGQTVEIDPVEKILLGAIVADHFKNLGPRHEGRL
jgi:hypothetical protein